MRIGELADRAAVTTKTIRYYESIGLLPAPERTASGYRDYGPGAEKRLGFIRDAQATGLTLAEIGSVLDLKSTGEGTCGHTKALLERHLAEIEEQIRRLEEARIELRALADRAATLDPTACTDPHRCQVVTGGT